MKVFNEHFLNKWNKQEQSTSGWTPRMPAQLSRDDFFLKMMRQNSRAGQGGDRLLPRLRDEDLESQRLLKQLRMRIREPTSSGDSRTMVPRMMLQRLTWSRSSP